MTYYFGNYFNNEDLQKLCLATGEMVARALAILSETFAVQYLMDMLLHFNQLVDEMVAYCKRLIPFISAYRAPHNPETLNVLEKFISSDNQPLVRKRLMDPREADIIPLENQTYSVCHINQCIIKYLSQNGNYLYILGCDCHVFLSRLLHYRHVTMQSIVTSLGHPVKVEIINALRDKELTVSQLARRLQLARPSISRYIDDLLDELVIIQSRKSGPEIYYRLNGTYFQNAKKTITRYLDETIVDVDRLL